MIKVSDYIVKRLAEYGVRHVFMVTGGGAMHLNDSFGRSKDIQYICNHHEQAAAMAAEGYARATGKLAVVCVTSGPGGTNALTGVIGQWLDSVPVLYLSGQMKRETLIPEGSGLRQLGDQEINIVDIVRPVTKFAMQIMYAGQVGWALDSAIFKMVHGRPGPVWLDIPLDIQSEIVNEEELICGRCSPYTSVPSVSSVARIIDFIKAAERPLILAGHGIRIAGAKDDFLALAEALHIPVVTSFNGIDLIPSDHPLYAGRVGTLGTYAGNYALQNCDLLISIGSRNNIRQVSYDWKNFAPQAKKVIVDIDRAELEKPTVKPDIAIHADAGEFIKALAAADFSLRDFKEWLAECRSFSAPSAFSAVKRDVDPYCFIETLTNILPDDAVIVSGNGTASIALFQSGIVKQNTRIIMNSGCAAMGYDLPASIGACFASLRAMSQELRTVVCLTGDGSIQMNIQEMQTLAHHQLPIKIFVLNNGGYKSIQMTQDNYFEGRHVGAGPDSGVSCPDIRRIAEAYRLPTMEIDNHRDMKKQLQIILNTPGLGPAVCEVQLTDDYTFNKSNLADFMGLI